MSRLTIFFLLLIIVFAGCKKKSEPSQWRGPGRQGVFYESNLIKHWPESGPELLWSFEGLGTGHSSVGIADDRIFINGMKDSIGTLYAFNLNGNILWQRNYNSEWHKNYTGARSTPVVAGDLVYLESGMGVVYCFDVSSGEILWQVDLLKKFDAENIQWGMSESLLIDGDRVICTPGGKEQNVVSLNRFTGETIWTSKGYGEQAAYCSPILVEHNNARLIVTMTSTSVIGIDATTGEFYWRTEQLQGNKIHANSPVFSNGVIYCSSASAKENQGLVALQLSNDGKSVKQLWRNENYKNLMGGIIIRDGFIYGSSYKKKEWYAIDVNSGKERLISEDLSGGAIVFADGLFYCYSDRGEMALVDMDSARFEINGKFDVPLGTDQHWSHPVIHNGKMYIRHGNALMVYNIHEQ